MAESLPDTGGGKTARKAKKAAKKKAAVKEPKAKKAKANGQDTAPAEQGHNLPSPGEQATHLAAFLAAMDEIKDEQEKLNGEFMADITGVKERYANLTGHSRKVLTKAYTKHRRAMKEELDRLEMESSERDQLDEVMSLVEALPLFGAAAAQKRHAAA